jgi:aminomethyltransferase
MDRLVDLEMEADFVSKAALSRIKRDGVSQRQVGLEFEGPPIVGSNDEFWPIQRDGVDVGYVTSAVYSPRLEKNIALGLVGVDHADIGTKAVMDMAGERRDCRIVPKPFYDPKKTLAAKG